jgi:uncharacterized peroxidase-related enzyme
MLLNDPAVDDVVRAMYDEDLADDGYISNHTRAWAHRPDVCQGFRDLRVQLGQDMALSAAELAVVIAATVAELADPYCSLAWGKNLAEATNERVAADVLRGRSPAELSDRESALAQWTRSVVRDPSTTTQHEVETLRAAGFSDRDIAEVTMLIAFRIAFSTVNAALGAEPDRQLAEGAPEAVRKAVDYGRPVATAPSVDAV